jgi:hypothetical protein
MLEADALERVVEFDVDAEIVGIEFEFVAWAQAASSATSMVSVATGGSKARRQCL